MIRMIPSTSPGQAKNYFAEALQKPDYYLGDQELQGRIKGKLAGRMEIEGPATRDVFYALAENVHPKTGQSLTPRKREDRVTGYDINFHCPKSVSIIHALSGDQHILEVFQSSVAATMKDIEDDTKTRVRKDGKHEDRDTGELVWAEFIHQTARPVEDHLPDPHLHAHCFVFNATWDDQETRYKAAKFRDIKRDMPYYQARFQKRLSDDLMKLGYQVRRTRNSFEIEGVPQAVIDHFSKRTDEIGRVAKEKGIHDAKQLDKLGAKTRSRKQKGLGMAQLKEGWRSQIMMMGKAGRGDGRSLREKPAKDRESADPRICVDHALQHCFERASVMPDRRVLETAYYFALGDHSISLDGVTNAYRHDGRIMQVKQGDRLLCTTKDVLKEEQRMIELARKGRNRFVPLYEQMPTLDLSEQQSKAVSHVLTTPDMVSIIRGAAGTGKTTLMRQAVNLIEKAGKMVTVVAPTAQASRGVLKEEGFADAMTVASLLVDKNLHKQLQDQVIWVDEAGLLGTKDMRDILELASQKNARVILGGDTRQHASVVRGDALRILNTVGGIKTAEVSKIVRQKNEIYRKAVEDLAQGHVSPAFEKLDDMGAIHTVDPLNPNKKLIEDYLKTIRKGKSALIISPTHKQGEAVTEEIRVSLKKTGKIGKKEIIATRLANLNLTEAEKADWRKYQQGQIIQFNQNARGIKRGSLWTVGETEQGKVCIQNDDGETITLPFANAKKFEVFEKQEIKIAKGDRVQITKNGFDISEKRLNNGMMLKVASVTKKGEMVLKSESGKSSFKLDKNFGHFAHAHCITSYAAQGKTVDEVFIAQPSSTFAATDARQFYVSVSRGRDAAKIYTDDKDALLDYASELGERQSAVELVRGKNATLDFVLDRQRSEPAPEHPSRNDFNTTDRVFSYAKTDISHEPGS